MVLNVLAADSCLVTGLALSTKPDTKPDSYNLQIVALGRASNTVMGATWGSNSSGAAKWAVQSTKGILIHTSATPF